MMKNTLLALALYSTLLLGQPAQATEPTQTAGTLVELHTFVQKNIPNDMGHAMVYAEIIGVDPAEVANKVKAAMAEGFAMAEQQPGVQAKSGRTLTWPVYGKKSRAIESWRMRSEITLESRDATALSSVLGKLQATLAIGSLQFVPAAETRRKAEEVAGLEAIEAFRAQAGRVAGALQKSYRIRQMNIDAGHPFPQAYPNARGALLMSADAAPMPTEAGESTITVTIHGQIELLD